MIAIYFNGDDMLRTSYNKYKRVFLLYLIIIIIGVITGSIYSQKININIYQSLMELINIKKIYYPNYYHILFLLMTVTTSFIYIGPFFSLFSAFLEGFGIGMITLSLIIKKRTKGALFSLLFIIFNKLLYFIIILLLGIISIKFILNKKDGYYNKYKYLKISLILILISIINEIIFSNITNKICLYFSFLIK